MTDDPLRRYLSELSVFAPTVCKPEGEEPWKDLVARISKEGSIAEIEEETYFYWLEVLPPKFMRGSVFCFAEGAEPFRLFWQTKDNRYCGRQLTWDETRKLCELSGTSFPYWY